MSRDDFDMGSFGDLEEPSFSDNEADFLPPDTPSPRGTPPRNTTFLIVAVALVVIFILGLVGIALFAISNSNQQAAYDATAAAIKSTNDFVSTAIHATETAKAWSPTPTPTDTLTPTPTDTPTETPTDTPVVTDTPTQDDTATALALTAAVDDMTSTAVSMQPTNDAATIAAGGKASTAVPPTAAIAVKETATPSPTPGKVPNTGFFDDLAGGRASANSLALFAIMALGLVSVIFTVRRLRVQ